MGQYKPVDGDRVRCPLCSRRTVLRYGQLSRHKHGDEWCKGSGRTTFEATVVLAQSMAARAKEVGGHG